MFRIGLKFPCDGLNRVKKQHYSKVYLTARYYETQTRVKCVAEGRPCKDIRLASRFSGHKYSTESIRRDSEKGRGKGILITVGAITFCTLGTLFLAQKNDKVRDILEQWIPGISEMFKDPLKEENDIIRIIKSPAQNLLGGIFEEKKEPDAKVAPSPAFKALVDKKDPPINEPYSAIRVRKEKEEKVEVVTAKPSPPPKDVLTDQLPANLVELEKACGEAATEAIAAYQKATSAIQNYNRDVMKLVESIGSSVTGQGWERLKEASQKGAEALKQAEEHASENLNLLKRMSSRVNEPDFNAPDAMKSVAKRNIKKILDDVDNAKKKYEEELRNRNITEQHWKEVRAAREGFNEELNILFPNININEKKFPVSDELFDLFTLYMHNKISYLQKELSKLQTIYESKVKSLMRTSGEDVSEERIKSLLDLEFDKAKRNLQDEFDKKLLTEQKKLVEELRRQLLLHSQVHADHLAEALAVKEQEAQRTLKRTLSEQAEELSTKYKTQLAAIIGRLQGVDAAFKARLQVENDACNAQLLWSACQTLARAVKVAPPGTSADVAIRPLEPEIKAVCKVAPKGDALVHAAIAGIPEEAAKRGVFPEDTLRERFLKVEKMARKLALVPEQGASLPVYLLSYLQSFLIIDNVNPISKSELMDEPVDVSSLNTYEILHRARYWVDRGNFKMTLRYMNLLKGAPRSIARDWMNETKILLETQQAIDTLVTYAGAIGLIFLGSGEEPAKVSR